ncbi:MAG: cobalamin biosynthesis protein [Lachnospiraceae bacterium]|nr:cobalamin biosynthesis protein [Lachnospiraceae bacterium]
MKITGICFTRSGMELGRRMHAFFSEQGAGRSGAERTGAGCTGEAGDGSENSASVPSAEPIRDTWFCKGKLFREQPPADFALVEESMQEWTGKHFDDSDAMIFIGAAGICVRAIAPYVKDKKTDPAVLVFDEKGTFGISLLSGHIGGANALTDRLCRYLGSIPVVTTATDVNHKFAVDQYAAEHGLAIESMSLAKAVAAALVEGKTIPFSADTEIVRQGPVPGGLRILPYEVTPEHEGRGDVSVSERSAEAAAGSEEADLFEQKEPLGIHVSPFTDHSPYQETLRLIPRCITLGIGCRRDTPVEKIEALVDRVLTEHHIHPEAVCAAATIDLKKNEPGLLEFCRRRNLPLTVYSAEELKAVEGAFSASPFVSGITGVDNVCERSAVKKSGGTLIVNKTKGDSSTCAAALEDWRIKL